MSSARLAAPPHVGVRTIHNARREILHPRSPISDGDSAALLISEGTAKELTVGQRKNPPIGRGTASVVPFAATVMEPWRVLLMSDGVGKYGGWDRVIEIARRASGSTIVAELQRLVRLPGSGCFQDDYTVVVLESLADENAAAAGVRDTACRESPVP